MIRTVFQKLIFAGLVDRVVQRGAAAIVQLVHAGREQGHIVGEILRHLAVAVEAHHKRLVEAGAHRVLQKTGGRVLLKIEPAVHRSADIDQQAQVQGQIGFAAEVQDRLRRLVIVKNGEIVLVQIADELAVLVGRDEQHVDFIHPRVQGDHRVLRIVGILDRRSRRSAALYALRLGAPDT